MKPYILIAPALLLVACTAQAPNKAPSANSPAVTTTAPSTRLPAPSSTATATGTIEAIDAAAGKITIAHGPVPSLDWPAMTMSFQATAEQIARLRPGQKVRFEFEGSTAKIVTIGRPAAE